MGLSANVSQQQTCGIGSTKASPSTTAATGIHFARLRGMNVAKSSVPAEVTVLSRPPRLKQGAQKGPSLRIEKNTEA
eukprot:5233465-Pyramimonas_sp.AAC.1